MLLLLRTQILEKPCLGRKKDKWKRVGGQQWVGRDNDACLRICLGSNDMGISGG